MPNQSEQDVLNKLKIDSWRHLSKDKFLDFVSAMSNMDKDVVMAAVAQFPNFKDLALGALTTLQTQAEGAHRFNWKSQKRVHEAFAGYRSALQAELDRGQLSTEERFHILGLIREAVAAEGKKDSENKNWLLKVFGGVASVVLALGVFAVAALGGKAGLKGPGGA